MRLMCVILLLSFFLENGDAARLTCLAVAYSLLLFRIYCPLKKPCNLKQITRERKKWGCKRLQERVKSGAAWPIPL